MPVRNTSAKGFCSMLEGNVDNDKLSDVDFRRFVRNTLPIVDFKDEPVPITTRYPEYWCEKCQDKHGKLCPNNRLH